MVSENTVSTEPKGMHTQINSIPTTFKVLQRETSVYEYFVELKEKVFSQHGFFDLIQVSGLRVTGAGQFLKNLRNKNRLRQKDIAKILNVREGTISNWENHGYGIPLELLVTVAKTFDISKDTIYSMIEKGIFSFRRVRLPVKWEQIRDIVPYLSPLEEREDIARITLLNHFPESLSKTLRSLNIKPKTYGGPKQICSSELYQYLKTFFQYTKVPKLHLPLTTEVKGWHELGVDLKRAIIIPSLQSDGAMDQSRSLKRLRFIGKSKALHNTFVDAIYYQYNELPTSYCKIESGKYVTTYIKKSINDIANELMNLAGNTKTTPAPRQSVEEYLKEPQPHLNYLINAPKDEQKIALRIWASTEGHISIYRSKRWIYPILTITCTHPVIIKQLKQLAKNHGIHFTLSYVKKTWSGIGWLSNQSLKGCINFLKLGGFIKDVKISSHSPYHEGIAKDVLTLGILEYIKQRHMNKWQMNLPIEVHHHNINQIIRNKDYQSADSYIDYFS